MKKPRFVALELTSRCQLRCKGCFSSPEDYPKGDMDFDFYKSVIDRMDQEMWLNPYANGEPLLYPRILEAIQYATERNIRNYITTNGMIFNEELFRYIFKHPYTCYQLIFSLDGLWDEKSRSIELARPGSDREKIKETISKVLEMKREIQSPLTIMVKMCERGQDHEEQENFISYWLQQEGVNAVVTGRLFESFSTEGFRIFPCQYSDNQFMLIRWDGTAVMCMYHPEVMSKGALPIGRLDKETPLISFYNNEAYSSFRERQARGDFPEPCRTCGISYTGNGIRGSIRFRNSSLLQREIFFRADHYNSFYSLEENRKPDASYGWRKE
jgi:MoaA/NifB/PqqE/SkfB family radical SAM enzyme